MRKKFYYLGEYWKLVYRSDEAEVYCSVDRRKWLYVFKDGEEKLILLGKDDDADIIASDKGKWLYVLKGKEKLTSISQDDMSTTSNEENDCFERIISGLTKLKEVARQDKLKSLRGL